MARWWERVSRALQMEEVGAGWPAEIIPYRAGMIGGLAGGSAMVLVAIAYGLLSGRGIWFPVNLIGHWGHPGPGAPAGVPGSADVLPCGGVLRWIIAPCVSLDHAGSSLCAHSAHPPRISLAMGSDCGAIALVGRNVDYPPDLQPRDGPLCRLAILCPGPSGLWADHGDPGGAHAPSSNEPIGSSGMIGAVFSTCPRIPTGSIVPTPSPGSGSGWIGSGKTRCRLWT